MCIDISMITYIYIQVSTIHIHTYIIYCMYICCACTEYLLFARFLTEYLHYLIYS